MLAIFIFKVCKVQLPVKEPIVTEDFVPSHEAEEIILDTISLFDGLVVFSAMKRTGLL